MDADNKATVNHVPSQECPFSQRLTEQAQNLDEQLAQQVLKYCAAHLCHLAKLNVQNKQFKQARKILADRRCGLKPLHRTYWYAKSLLGQTLSPFRAS